MDYYRKQTGADKIEWIDIMSEGFDPHVHGLDPERIHARFHVKKSGQIFEGVDGFQLIWQELKIFKIFDLAAQTTLTRSLMNFGYDLFVKIRPYLPRKSSEQCSTDACVPKSK
ncbi:MAG: DCC1-like thiol-disulfide oxidoreductase family protein [Bdellovibrionales bacterium]